MIEMADKQRVTQCALPEPMSIYVFADFTRSKRDVGNRAHRLEHPGQGRQIR